MQIWVIYMSRKLPKGVPSVTQLSEWASQYYGELEKQSSTRAAQVESLLTAGDYEAIREWLEEWEAEDKALNSLFQQYRSARQELREERYGQR
jgi:5-bromo-4-chloroindolyl phosphate hydrolysis protein